MRCKNALLLREKKISLPKEMIIILKWEREKNIRQNLNVKMKAIEGLWKGNL